MSRAPDATFIAVTTEGGLLPTQLLHRIAQPDARTPLAGRDPAAYHLHGMRLEDEINQAWARLKTTWHTFRAALAKAPPDAAHTGLTRDRWLMPLLQTLGYGRLPTAPTETIDDRPWPISHRYDHSPIHLLGFNVPIDTRTKGTPGAARTTPHGLMQGYLNRKNPDLWGLLSNGRQLRILRDHESLTRQAYVEFDLEAIFDGDLFSDFRLLWLLCHQSRLEGTPADCWLEKWHAEAREQGIAWQEDLRGAVQQAIEALGCGYLDHPRNEALRAALRDPNNPFDRTAYNRELRRTVYRLIFLFVAEDRGILLDPHADPQAHARYRDWYATHRIRRLAETRIGGPQPDLWRALRLVLDALADGQPALALPALGTHLFTPDSTPHLATAELSNAHLLRAIRALCATEADGIRYPVDWRTIGADELGSVFESLLELHPDLNIDAARFQLTHAAGHERKTTGSYYTPAPLVDCLLDTALDPILDRATRASDPQAALLDLKICDPACGSGHFLLAAARRVAHRLAAIRTDEEDPAPDAIRHALRDVVARCVYGVDLNDMAVELCRFGLWLEALDPGRPLAFLDSHIKHGNALLGATPRLLRQGIPDDAFDAIEGDDKKTCTALRKRNKQERAPKKVTEGYARQQVGLPLGTPWTRIGDYVAEMLALEAISDNTPAGQRRKQHLYDKIVKSAARSDLHLWPDAWCAAFVIDKTPEAIDAGRGPITEAIYRGIEANPAMTDHRLRDEVEALAERYRFFHWHLEFPQVFRVEAGQPGDNSQMGWSGGFDVMLGNPPWDKLTPDPTEFFSTFEPEIRVQSRATKDATIARLTQDPRLSASWREFQRNQFAEIQFLKESGRYQLFAEGNLGKGDFNVYRMFVESALNLTRRDGIASQFVPDGFYGGANCAAIRTALFTRHTLLGVFGFENRGGIWFSGIHRSAKFTLYAASHGGETVNVRAGFRIDSLTALTNVMNGTNSLLIPVAVIREFSPDALAIMEFDSQAEIDICTKLYKSWPTLGQAVDGAPSFTRLRELDMTNDSNLFRESPPGMPVYEGRMVSQYDHRAKGYRSGRGRSAVWDELPFDGSKAIEPQWHVADGAIPDRLENRAMSYRVGFCDVASPTNERSLVAAMLPRNVIAGNKVPTVTGSPHNLKACTLWLAAANSFTLDFIVRKKVSLQLSFTILDSLPFPRPPLTDPSLGFIAPRVLRLTCTGPEMNGYWNAMANAGGWVEAIAPDAPPPGATDDTERRTLMAELDAFVARVFYGLTWVELEHILSTFPIVEKRDRALFGDYRTRELIKHAYDRIDAQLAADVTPDRLLTE